MTTQDIIAEHTRRISMAVQNAERERVIHMIEPEIARHRELGLNASANYLEYLVERIKGEQK